MATPIIQSGAISSNPKICILDTVMGVVIKVN